MLARMFIGDGAVEEKKRDAFFKVLNSKLSSEQVTGGMCGGIQFLEASRKSKLYRICSQATWLCKKVSA